MLPISFNSVLTVVARVATALFGLASLRLTYFMLSAEDFTRLSQIFFFLAASSAIASPLNRRFWAENSYIAFVNAICWTMLLHTVTLLTWLLVDSGMHSQPATWLVLFFLSGSSYVFVRTLERYLYGQLLFDKSLSVALRVPFVLALLEMLLVLLMCQFHVNSLMLRLALPSVVFVIAVASYSFWRKYLGLFWSVWQNGELKSTFFRNEMFSTTGTSTIGLTLILTLVSMLDRYAIVYACPDDPQFQADYLLALSYTIALQTLMNVSIDVAKKHVYTNGQWSPEARPFAGKLIVGMTVVSLCATTSYPILQSLSILPNSIGFALWASLATRSMAILIIMLACIDFVQSGETHRAFPWLFGLLAVVFVFLFLLNVDQNSDWPAIVLMGSCLVLSATAATRFFLRMPQLARGPNE